MHRPMQELMVRSFHFKQTELQELVGSLDMAVEGYDEFDQCYLTRTVKEDMLKAIMKLVENVVARKQEYEGIARQQEF